MAGHFTVHSEDQFPTGVEEDLLAALRSAGISPKQVQLCIDDPDSARKMVLSIPDESGDDHG
jgi:hypothetical protein